MSLQITTLDNGLSIITEKLEKVETAAMGFWVKVGARHETESLNGIAHFLEHMAFKGTKSRTAKQIAEEIEDVGGHLNAYTSREMTAYHARLLGQDIPLGIDLLCDILQESTFHEEEFEKERHVILQELAQSIDTPDDIVFDHFQSTAFPHQPLGRPILGTFESLASFSSNHVKAFIQDHYALEHMVFAATGKVHHDQIVELLEEKVKHIPSSLPLSPEQGRYKGGIMIDERPLEQVQLLVGYEGVHLHHPLYYAQTLLANLLGGGMSSRLFQEVREKRGLVYSIYAFGQSYHDTGLFTIHAGTSADKLKEVVPVIGDVLHTFLNDITAQEIKRGKAQLKAGLMMGLESTSGRCEQLAQHMSLFGKPIPASTLIERIEHITIDDLKDVLGKILTSSPTQVAVGPVQEMPLLP